MPELPDVELFKRTLDRTALHRRVEHVAASAPRVIDGTSTAGLGRVLQRRLPGLQPRAMEIPGRLPGPECTSAAVPFPGCTGRLASYGDPAEAPEHARLILELDDGTFLAFDDQRLFGKVALAKPEDYLRRHEVGPDALRLSESEIAERIGSSRGFVKRTLMDQSRLSGIGNVYSDEVLFRARIHPRKRASSLSDQELGRVARSVRYVLTEAIDRHADPKRAPRSWLLPHRDNGEHCPRCNNTLETCKISGRRGWFCPHCQGSPS